MAFYDRVRFKPSGAPGTGAITVGTAETAFRTPAGASIPNSTALTIMAEDGAAWEICESVYTTSGTSCSRGTLIQSSTGSRISLSATAIISVVASARQIIDKHNGDTMPGALTISNSTASTSTSTGALIVSGGVGIAGSAYVGGNLAVTTSGANVAIGGGLDNTISLYIRGNTSAASTTVYGVYFRQTIQSAVTGNYYGIRVNPSTAAASFTLGNVINFLSNGLETVGAGSSVTNHYAFFVASNFTSATNNYGFFSQLDAATGRWGLYFSGTARNYMAGALSIGGTTDPGTGGLYVGGTTALAGNLGIGVTAPSAGWLYLAAGTTAKSQINFASSTAPTSPNNGDFWFDGTDLKLRAGGATYTITKT